MFAQGSVVPVAELVASTQGQVHLVRVVREADARTAQASALLIQPAMGYGLWGGRPTNMGEGYLDEMAERYFPKGSERKVIIGEDPAREILRYAAEEGVDLIAMATHGCTGLARVVMGSVADKLLSAGVVSRFFLVRPTGLH